jgi:hypothetical protein
MISASLQLALLVLYCFAPEDRTKASIAATTLNLIGALILGPITYAEHRKTTRPSFLINGYFLVAILLDGTQVRSLWLANVKGSIVGVFTATFVMRGIHMIAESFPKTRWLTQGDGHKSSPEDFAGIISKTFFLWINQLIRIGYVRDLSFPDLFPMPAGFSSVTLEQDLWTVWEKGISIMLRILLLGIRSNCFFFSQHPRLENMSFYCPHSAL